VLLVGMGGWLSVPESGDVVDRWSSIVRRLLKIMKLRRIWHNLGTFLRQYAQLQLPDKKR